MAFLIKNALVYAPEELGAQDILVVDDKIAAVGRDLTVVMPDLETIDAKGRIVTPGFIDQHIHVTGGGGEGGPKTRTPEIMLSELIECGTTSLVGVSGTDSVTRSIENLLAKVRALTSEGVSAWMYTSNYEFPPTTLSGSVRKDLLLVPEVLGVKIALGDHRSSFPTTQEVLHLLTDIRVGGMIAGKLGVLHVHTGNVPGAFEMYDEILAKGFPIRHIRPTHCARDKYVFEKALAFARKGGRIDITTGGSCCFASPADAVQVAWESGIDESLITLSSDGHGSVPRFNDKGEMVGLGVGGVACNLRDLKVLLFRGERTSKVLSLLTKNVARALELPGKGEIKKGASADLCFFDADWNLQSVMSRGVVMMRDKDLLVKGTFEL
jgi:beta-aspartyl-dipeptidase (metallo-type)